MDKAAHLELSPLNKRLLLICAVALSLLNLKRVLFSVTSAWIYKKDFMSGYLLAKALWAGVNPYLPLPVLAQIWVPQCHYTELTHPTPHQFAIGWLCLPLAWLPYEQAARFWLGFEFVCLALAIFLLFRVLHLKLSWRAGALVAFLALGWLPVFYDLWLGQLSLLLLVLFLGAWLGLRAGRPVLGGMLLGFLLLLKLAGWPVVLWLAWRRQWRAVWMAAATCFGGHALAVWWHGWAMVQNYYMKIGPQVSALYRTHDANFSVWTLGVRLFAEAGENYRTVPFWFAPGVARVVGMLAPLLVLGLALWLAHRLRDFDLGFALLMLAGVALNPIAWTHYLILTVPAWGLIFQRLAKLDWPRTWSTCALLLFAPLSVSQESYTRLVLQFATGADAFGRPLVPALPALLSLIVLIALGVLVVFFVRLFSQAEAQLIAVEPPAFHQLEMA